MYRKITVETFVEEYKKIEDRSEQKEFVKSIVYRTYAPILEKKVALQAMFDKAVCEDGVIKYVDMTISKVNFVMALIALYTNLNIIHSKDDNKSNFDDYDYLRESGAISDIENIIGENEVRELLSVNQSIMDTFYNQNSSTEALVTKSINRLAKLSDVFIDSLASINLKELIDLRKNIL